MKISNLQTRIQELNEEKKKEILAIETRNKSALLKERDKHADDIQKFKLESEKILKDSQGVLLEQFEKDKQQMMKDHQTFKNESEQKETNLSVTIQEKEKFVKELQELLKDKTKAFDNSSQKNLSMSKQIEDLNQQLKTLKNKVEQYEKLLNEMKVSVCICLILFIVWRP